MPRYYFHIREPNEVITDTEGSELRDIEAARARAYESARCIMAESVRNGMLSLSHAIEITNEAGEVVATISYVEAINIA